MLPTDQGQKLAVLFEEFYQEETPEAKFAQVMDNFQLLLLNDSDSNDGKDWKDHQVHSQQVYKR